jgi:uncharacterized membrane protein
VRKTILTSNSGMKRHLVRRTGCTLRDHRVGETVDLRFALRKSIVDKSLHPLHAAVLSGMVPLFLAAFLSDWAYSETYEIQWKNFASWLLLGGLVFGGFTLLWAVIDISRNSSRTTRQFIYVSLLLVLWVLGFINVLIHAGDAWASMQAALILSAIGAVLVIAATWSGFARSYRGVAA